jgi:hypothetical protein
MSDDQDDDEYVDDDEYEDLEALDAEEVLAALCRLKAALPLLESLPYLRERSGQEAYDKAVAELTEVAREVPEVIGRAHEAIIMRSMSQFRALEELSHDPQHAYLAPLVERLRRNYEEIHGRPIPPLEDGRDH